jgi:hypothetical protein
MAKSSAFIPSWVRTLDAMIETDARIRVGCDQCKVWRDVDLVGLREKVGGDYSLLNRRCRCRLTAGCDGWTTLQYCSGVFRHLAEPEVRDRWLRESIAKSLGRND